MVADKNRAIVLAAREVFLRDGYSEASMDVIAMSAGVSVKTIYSHFKNKNELFREVMLAACGDQFPSGEMLSTDALSKRFSWFSDATRRGLTEAGKDYLRHLLSDEQMALYRVVTRDAYRFPELGRQYQDKVARGRTRILVAYLKTVTRANGREKENPARYAALYEALLRSDIYEQALHGLLRVDPVVIGKHARSSSRMMWKILAPCK